MHDFRISLATYSFHGALSEGKIDINSYLDLLRFRYRVDWADIWSGMLPTLDGDFLRKVRARMDSYGIGLANLCVDGPYLWCDDADERAAHKKQMLEYLRAAELLGAQTVRIDFGGAENTEMSDEAFEYIVSTYREYCGICGGLGMRIGLENHWGWDRIPSLLKRVRDAVDSPVYGHLFHFTNSPAPEDELNSVVIPYAMHTHIPANSIPKAKELIRRLAASGYSGTYSIEHHSGRLEFERVEWQLAAVREMIAELRDEGLDAPARDCYISEQYAE